MTSIVDEEDFDLSVYDLHPSDDIREAIDVYITALQTSYSSLNINDYISIDRDVEHGVHINENSFEKDLNYIVKPYEELTDKLTSFLLTIIIKDFRDKFNIYKEAINNGKTTIVFPMSEWRIKDYEDKYSTQITNSILYANWGFEFPESFSIEDKLKVLNPFVTRRLKIMRNDVFLSNNSKIENNEIFNFLENDKNILTSKLLPEYIKQHGNIVDHYYFLAGKPYFLKDKLCFLALRDDPFMENKANFYLKEDVNISNDSIISELNITSLFNQFLIFNLTSKDSLENFKAFKEISNSLPKLKNAGDNPDFKDKTMKIYLNALASYINEMRDVITLENKNIENFAITTIITIEKAFNGNNFSITESKAKSSDYFEYFLMKVDSLSLEKNNDKQKNSSNTLKKF